MSGPTAVSDLILPLFPPPSDTVLSMSSWAWLRGGVWGEKRWRCIM